MKTAFKGFRDFPESEFAAANSVFVKPWTRSFRINVFNKKEHLFDTRYIVSHEQMFVNTFPDIFAKNSISYLVIYGKHIVIITEVSF